MLRQDLRRKAEWMYGSDRWPSVLKAVFASGTMAMVIYRLMQWSRRCRLVPLELIFNKLNAVCCNCIIGRGAEFGPGLVLLYGTGIVINGQVRGGCNVTIYQQVTLGGEQDRVPVLGDHVLLAPGAKVVGPVRIGDGATVAANSAVFRNVPPGTTVLGVPAEPVWLDEPQPQPALANGRATGQDLVAPAPRESSLPSVPRPATIPSDAGRAELESRLVPCFAAAFGSLSPAEIPRAAVSSLPEWDSLASMTLLALIEEEFRLRIPVSELARLTSFAEILAYLTAHTAEVGAGRSIPADLGPDHSR
jgi:serine O-acetyltransferase